MDLGLSLIGKPEIVAISAHYASRRGEATIQKVKDVAAKMARADEAPASPVELKRQGST